MLAGKIKDGSTIRVYPVIAKSAATVKATLCTIILKILESLRDTPVFPVCFAIEKSVCQS